MWKKLRENEQRESRKQTQTTRCRKELQTPMRVDSPECYRPEIKKSPL